MFYNDQILAKKGALAKVWLAAHLDKKLSKAQIYQTNIKDSVDDILEGDASIIALRLSGQLLLGVVRIYSRKTRYLLEDCNEALVKIKMVFKPSNVELPDEQAMAPRNAITLHAETDPVIHFGVRRNQFMNRPEDEGIDFGQFTVDANSSMLSISTPRRQSNAPFKAPSTNKTARLDDITLRENYDFSLSGNLFSNLNFGTDLIPEFNQMTGPLSTVQRSAVSISNFGGPLGNESFNEVETVRRDQSRIGDFQADQSMSRFSFGLGGGLGSVIDMESVRKFSIGSMSNFAPMVHDDAQISMNLDTIEENPLLKEISMSLPPTPSMQGRSFNNVDSDQPAGQVIGNENLESQLKPPSSKKLKKTVAAKQQARRKNKTIGLDNVLELSNSEIARQLKDTSNICKKGHWATNLTPISVGKSYAVLKAQQDEKILFGQKYFDPPQSRLPPLQPDVLNADPVVSEVDNHRVPSVRAQESDNLPDQMAIDSFNDNINEPPMLSDNQLLPNNDNNYPLAEISIYSPAADKPPFQSMLSAAADAEDQENFPGGNSDNGTPMRAAMEGSTLDSSLKKQSSLSGNSIKTIKLLQSKFQSAQSSGGICLSQISSNAKRSDVCKFFLELLLLKSRNIVNLSQPGPYQDIKVTPNQAEMQKVQVGGEFA
ncbi:hypothetical protein MP228_010690 [Amoeboaphelidium protococcarum]|nr:hypothetical protein MP228_010690 [Amoeboaphelidium protococcarum]